jgi:hypothetical protein
MAIFSFFFLLITVLNAGKQKVPVLPGLFEFLCLYLLTNRFSFKSREGLIKKVKEIKSDAAHLLN